MADTTRLTLEERQLFFDSGFSIRELELHWTDEAVDGWLVAARAGEITVGGGEGLPLGQAGALPQILPMIEERGLVGDVVAGVGGAVGEAVGGVVAGFFKRAAFWVLVTAGVVAGMFFLTRRK